MIVSSGIIPAPPIYGGAIESHTFVLANALGQEGATVHYVSDLRKGASLQANVTGHPVHAPIRKFPVPFPGWVVTHALGGLLSARASLGVTSRLAIDAAHFHEETSALLYLEMRAKVPVVFTLHNPPPWVGNVSSHAERLARSMISAVVAEKVIRKADHFIALSKPVADGFTSLLGLDEEHVSVVPHPIDTDFFRPDPAHERQARETFGLSGPYVLFVGRLDPRKGARNLLLAAARLDPKPTTVIVGDGIEKRSLIDLSKRLGIRKSTSFLGAVPTQLLPGLFSAADCLVFPSVSEMSPLTVVEALASGTPVIAFRLPVLSDVIRSGYNGFLLSSDVESLASTIALLTNDHVLRRRMKENARASALKNNSPSEVARRLLQIYRNLS